MTSERWICPFLMVLAVIAWELAAAEEFHCCIEESTRMVIALSKEDLDYCIKNSDRYTPPYCHVFIASGAISIDVEEWIDSVSEKEFLDSILAPVSD